MLSFFRLLIVFLALAPVATMAQPNGCGSGWSRYLVPNSLPLANCQFKASCNQHDVCYGRCGDLTPAERPAHCEYLRCKKGGDLYGKQTCGDTKFVDLKESADVRKQSCDANFYDDIVKANDAKSICRVFAKIYKKAVVAYGEDAFVGIDGVIKPPLSDSQEQRSVKAISELLSTLSERELREYERLLDTNTAGVDLTKEVAFSKVQRKLYNP